MAAIVDTFNRADNAASLGTTSDGTATWAVSTGTTFGIATNQAKLVTGNGGDSWAVVDPGSADGIVQVTVTATGASGWDAGIAFRVSSDANFWRLDLNNGGNFSGFYKSVSGGVSNVGGQFTWTVGDTIKVEMSGSTLKGYRNGSLIVTITDAFNATATKHGLYANLANATLDSFSYTPIPPPPPRLLVAQRAAIVRASAW